MSTSIMTPTPDVVITLDRAALTRYRAGQRGPEEREAWAAYLRGRRLAAAAARQERESRRVPGRALLVHGTERCYRSGCRRPECRHAASTARAKARRESAEKLAS